MVRSANLHFNCRVIGTLLEHSVMRGWQLNLLSALNSVCANRARLEINYHCRRRDEAGPPMMAIKKWKKTAKKRKIK